MRVKYSDPGAILPLYTRETLQSVEQISPSKENVRAQQGFQRDLPRPSLPSKPTYKSVDEETTVSSNAADSTMKTSNHTLRRRLNRMESLQGCNDNDDGPGPNSQQQRLRTRFPEESNSSRPTRSSGRQSDRLLDLSTNKTLNTNSKAPIALSSVTTPALIRFTTESLDRSKSTLVEHIGDDHYLVTGTNWRWETSFPVTTSGDLRTLIHTFDDNTCPPPQTLPPTHLTRGGATHRSDKDSESTSEGVPDLTMGSSPPQQASPSPPPRTRHRRVLTPRPSSGRTLKPTAKLLGWETVRPNRTRTSRDRESSWASDEPVDVRARAAAESNASGIKIQLRKASPARSGIRLSLKSNGSTSKKTRGLRAVTTVEQDDEGSDEDGDEPVLVATRASKRARFVKT